MRSSADIDEPYNLRDEPLFSITDPAFLNGSITICSPTSEHAYTKNQCDRDDLSCPYSSQFNFKHYHSPEMKCTLPGAIHGGYHEHCISRLRALPSKAGECILSTLPSRDHECCYWNHADCADWPPIVQKRCRTGHARKRSGKMHDLRPRVKAMAAPKLPIEDKDIGICGLNDEGSWMYEEDLRDGLLNKSL